MDLLQYAKIAVRWFPLHACLEQLSNLTVWAMLNYPIKALLF